MHKETIAVHGGYETGSTTKAVAVPIIDHDDIIADVYRAIALADARSAG
jgi:hypothetical protein